MEFCTWKSAHSSFRPNSPQGFGVFSSPRWCNVDLWQNFEFCKMNTKTSLKWIFLKNFVLSKTFEFSRAFINSDICKCWDLFAAQFTFSEMFLIAFDKILLTFGYFFDYFEPFSQNEAVVLIPETTRSFSAFPSAARSLLSSGKIKARKFK